MEGRNIFLAVYPSLLFGFSKDTEAKSFPAQSAMAEAAPSYKSALDSTRIQAVPTRYSSGALPGAGVSVYVEGQSDSGHSKG